MWPHQRERDSRGSSRSTLGFAGDMLILSCTSSSPGSWSAPPGCICRYGGRIFFADGGRFQRLHGFYFSSLLTNLLGYMGPLGAYNPIPVRTFSRHG